jgi:hypothetical protein
MVAVAQESSGSASSRPETNHLHQAQVVGFLICIVVFCPAPRRVDAKESSKRGLWIPHAVLHGASPIRIIAVRLHVLIRARPSLVRFGVAILAEFHTGYILKFGERININPDGMVWRPIAALRKSEAQPFSALILPLRRAQVHPPKRQS